MKREAARTCWHEPALIVALTRDPSRYVRLAQALLDVVPDAWDRISASMVIDSRNAERCTLEARCGCTEPAPDGCLVAVREAIVAVAGNALIPKGLTWVGVWIDFDVPGDVLRATLMHGGPLRPASPPEPHVAIAQMCAGTE